MYQSQRKIASISQGDVSVAMYSMSLKKLLEELMCLVPIPPYICNSTNGSRYLNALSQLMLFLMGLNESYDHVRNQIPFMDPLPSINKAYSMILRVEKQQEIH